MIRRIVFISSSLAFVSALFFSCDKKVAKNTTVAKPVVAGACDSVTYAKHIESIINAKCTSCHSAGGQSPNLTNYSGAKGILDNGKLKQRVVEGTPSFMPPSGKLPQNEINLIQCWIDNGGKEQ